MQMIEQTAAVALLQQSLRDISTGWSLGTFGALAEFHHVASDLPPLITLTSNGGEVITGRGAMRAAFCEEVLPLAYEGLTQDPRGWNQTLSFCLRTELARMAGRAVLMELGPDKGAIREADREAILFDLGVDAAHVDFCVRTDDPELVAALRQAAGQSVLEPGHPALAAIAAASPHRVATSRLGRIEVYQPIPTGPTLTDRPAHSSAFATAAQRPHPFGERADPARLDAGAQPASAEPDHRLLGPSAALRRRRPRRLPGAAAGLRATGGGGGEA